MSHEKMRNSTTVQQAIKVIREEAGSKPAADGVKVKNQRQCEVSDLREGMILAEDILAEEGVILLRRGTYISSHMAQRLREITTEAGERGMVWIGDLVPSH